MIDDLTTADIAAFIVPLLAEKYDTGNRVRAFVSRVIDHAVAHNRADGERRNLAQLELVKATAPQIKRPRSTSHAALPWEEVPDLVARLIEYPNVPRAQALLMTVLSGLRTKEVSAGALVRSSTRRGGFGRCRPTT